MQAFELNLEENTFELHKELVARSWKPDAYVGFYIRDPKLRHIHKASVRDRVLYQAVFRALYPIFDPTFIHDSYSCRVGKGTHRGVVRLEEFLRKASANNAHPVYALKCDVRKFFDSVCHSTLLELIRHRINDHDTQMLVRRIVESFETVSGRGLPLGNVTSQLFANIYLNELDQFMKHRLIARYYLRYCDDFVVLGESAAELTRHIPRISSFLSESLQLVLHPTKVSVRKVSWGVDFLGYVALPRYRVLRASTRRRMFRNLTAARMKHDVGAMLDETFSATVNSFRGMLTHAKGHRLDDQVLRTVGMKS